jgi:hypothetical protein
LSGTPQSALLAADVTFDSETGVVVMFEQWEIVLQRSIANVLRHAQKMGFGLNVPIPRGAVA